MKIALAAQPFRNGDVDYNLGVILDTLGSVPADTDLVLFGEAVLQGFDGLTWDWERDRHIAVTRDAPVIQKIREAARRRRRAVSFGYYETDGEAIWSSQLFLGADGEVVDHYRRVSTGWKVPEVYGDPHYREGERFQAFTYGGRRFVTALCGDLWEQGNPEKIRKLCPDIVLWPVFCNYPAGEWNTTVKLDYARQAALAGETVLLVDPPEGPAVTAGGCAAWFHRGTIRQETPAGEPSILTVDIE